ncbi:hypothetical protein [Nostoc sp. FACHB-133]|uniref:hypothetical protein n=1 Tax=Nostoc sp. FACHB-133 TaxID=2692835 RepID=UPI001685F3FA|nr:hypothetical protein [Nostoc sp. FACHB-133]MBD2526057.1 hypothetical protein [Nostoc sp. FACHB-133]
MQRSGYSIPLVKDGNTFADYVIPLILSAIANPLNGFSNSPVNNLFGFLDRDDAIALTIHLLCL